MGFQSGQPGEAIRQTQMQNEQDESHTSSILTFRMVSRGIISQDTGHRIPAAHLISTGTRCDLINASDMMPISCEDRDMAANRRTRQLSPKSASGGNPGRLIGSQ